MHPVIAYYVAYLSNHWKGKKDKAVSAKDLIPTTERKAKKLELDPLMSGDEFKAAILKRRLEVQDEWIQKRLAEDH